MSMTLASAIAAVQTKAGALSGIKAAPTNPPESANQFPFAVSYPRTGRAEFASAGWANYFHTLFCEIHISRQLLPQAIATALPYAELLPSAIMADPTLGGTVNEVREVRYTFGRLEWGGVDTIGFRFEIDVKLNLT